MIAKWVENVHSMELLREVLFMVLNLLRRQECWGIFLEVLHEQVSECESLNVTIGDVLSRKGLFYIVYQLSAQDLRVKLVQDFAASHGAPFIIPNLKTTQGEIVEEVYHALRNESIGVIAFAVGEAASRACFKSQLSNEIFGTNFETGKSTFLTFGSADIDVGTAFEPDRKMSIVDVHGRLEDCWHRILPAFGHWLVHISAKDLLRQEESLKADLARFERVICESSGIDDHQVESEIHAQQNTEKRASLTKVVILIRDAFGMHDKVEDKHAEIVAQFPLLNGILGAANHRGTVVAIAMPDLRTVDTRTAHDIKFCKIRKQILSSVAHSIDALSKEKRELVSGAKAHGFRPQRLGKKEFTTNILRPTCDSALCEKYVGMHEMVTRFVRELEKHRDDFFQSAIVPVRAELKLLRDCEGRLAKLSEDGSISSTSVLDDVRAAKAEREDIVTRIGNAKPSLFLQMFMHMLHQSDALTLVGELAYALKNFVAANTHTEMVQLRKLRRERDSAVKIEELSKKIELKTFSIEILYRELCTMCHYSRVFLFPRQSLNPLQSGDAHGTSYAPLDTLREFVSVGEPFELIDGDNLKFSTKALERIFQKFKDMRVFILSVLGPQSSGKSTLLNFLLGSKFSTSTGRCTKGVYGMLVNIDHQHYDAILVLDTEGLQSVEKNDDEFDRKITLFCLAVSDLVLVNIKGDMHISMKRLLEVCAVSLQDLNNAQMDLPHIQFVFNQNSSNKKEPFLKQIRDITKEIVDAKPEASEIAAIMDVHESDVFAPSFAYNLISIEKNVDQGQMDDWCRCEPVSQFAVEVNKIAKKMTMVMTSRHEKKKAGTGKVLSA